jgi:hypothetical protein
MDWTNTTSGMLTTNNRSHNLTGRWSGLLTEEFNQTLKRGYTSTKLSSVWPHPSYLREHLLLNIGGVLFQGYYLGGHPVDHLTLLLSIVLEDLNRLGLSLHLPNKIVDHIGQLLDLDVLNVNITVQFIHYLPYSVRSLPDEVNTLVQTIDRMVLRAIHMFYLVIQHVDLRQELGPHGGGVLGVPLAPHLALSLFWLK